MSDFLKSAMGYFNSASTMDAASSRNGDDIVGGAQATVPETSRGDNEYVGQLVQIGDLRLAVQSVIAEGGYAFVYVAQDVRTGREYALKRLLATDKQASDAIVNELTLHKQLSGHPNIVAFVGGTCIDSKQRGRTEYLLLSEFCGGGTLVQFLMRKTPLQPDLILRIFYQCVRAVGHMHSQQPPIAHRDIKIDNFLIGNDKQIKMCDFGSASRETHVPTLDWNAQKRSLLEDELATVTTPMYRAPEMLDTWSNFEIGTKVDIWALGCVLYELCYRKHPFEDSGKLRILNGNYVLPADSQYSCFQSLIKGCLIVNPAQRFDISMLLERLAALSETEHWLLKGPIALPKEAQKSEPQLPGLVDELAPAPNGQAIKSNSTFYSDNDEQCGAESKEDTGLPHTSSYQSAGSNLLSSIRGGAGNLLKNIKNTSTKVMQSVQQSMVRSDLDLTCITSRILVMPSPSNGLESAYKTNHIDDVRAFIENRFAMQKVSIYNFGEPGCPRLPPPIRTVEAGKIYSCAQMHAPNLESLYSVVEDMYGFLRADPKTSVFIQTADSGGHVAAAVVSALLMYSDLLRDPEDAVQVYAVKRHPINLHASEFRYLYYFGDILRTPPLLPHSKAINIVSFSCQPVPRMTKARDGCRMFIEVYNNEHLLLSTMQDYEKMRLYIAGSGKIVLPINVSVCGDLTVAIYHARKALKGMAASQALKICQLQLNTGFIPEQETLIAFSRHDLDDTPDLEQVPANFTVSLSVNVADSESLPNNNQPWQCAKAKTKRKPQFLFSTKLEYDEMLDNFVTKPADKDETPIARKPTIPAAPTLILPDVTETRSESQPATFKKSVEPSPPIDLLNLDQPVSQSQDQKDPLATAMPSTDASFDLLGAFGDDESSGIGSPPIPDILPPTASTHKSSCNLDDILGSFDLSTSTHFNTPSAGISSTKASQLPPRKPNGSMPPFVGTTPTFVTTAPTGSKSADLPKATKDPFADLADLASGLKINFNPNTLSGKSAGSTPNTSSPSHLLGAGKPAATSAPNQHTRTNANYATPASFASANTSPINIGGCHRAPDYNRTHFETPKTSQPASGASKNEDIFADILGQQGYKFGNKVGQGPRSINEMRKEDVLKDMDPQKARILEWTDGKKNNIRALLCSMHTVLWASNNKWTKCEMSTLVTPAEVKKAYRRACLAVHPDKHNGTENEEIAKLVFMELNNAWTDFENDATQQNMFRT